MMLMRTCQLELLCVIVNHGCGSKVLKFSKKCGISGGTITFGVGTGDQSIWNFLGLTDIRKEIVYMAADAGTADETLQKIRTEFKLDQPNHGIAFSTTLCKIEGTRNCNMSQKAKEGEGEIMYQLITAIVEKGKAEEVVEAAISAGSKGGTIMNGRGSGVHETSKLFAMDVEPEREIVMILSEKEQTEAIISAIQKKMKLEEAGNAILYVQDVNQAYGLHQ